MTEQENTRFYIENEYESGPSIGSPVIKDRNNNNEIVCEDVYDTLELLNELANDEPVPEKGIFTFSPELLIRAKDMRLVELTSKNFELIQKERELKNAENQLYLNTDFKELKLTNDKMRNAYVSNAVSDLRFEIDQLKYEVKQQEDALTIINDLIKLRLLEVKD